jgi:hypothetical protein
MRVSCEDKNKTPLPVANPQSTRALKERQQNYRFQTRAPPSSQPSE